MSSHARWFVGLLLLGALLPASATAQLLVHPRRPSQTNVRYADFDWRYVDILTREKVDLDIEWQRGPRFHLSPYKPPATGTAWAWPQLSEAPLGAAATPDSSGSDTPDYEGSPAENRRGALGTAGGVRLYFYERERMIAERAAASIEASYRYLATRFDYAPRKTFAYFLYSSYIEFLQTDLFPIQEGVLGVTSTRSLEVTLPYFGDHRMFEDVSTHELAHEFTIQKLLSVAERANAPGPPLQQIPLWFIEGLAEYYAKRGLDAETEMLVRDMIVNPNDEGHVMGGFFEERLTSGLWTYKVGQARCAFLEEIYGEGTIQRILEETPRLLRSASRGGVSTFPKLVAKVTGDRPARIAARFDRWVKRRAFQQYLETSQDRVDMVVMTAVEGRLQALSATPSGHVLMYRSIDPDTGSTSLYLLDRHAPAQTVHVARDGTPGVESLHPVAGRNFDVVHGRLAFVAQRGGRDVVYLQDYAHEVEIEPCAESGERAARVCGWDVDLDLGTRRAVEVGKRGLLTVEAVALSPDGRQVALIGLGENGQKDLFVTTRLDDEEWLLLRLTNDDRSERELTWGPDGIVFSSDATGHGHFNLFRIDPALPGRIERLTRDPQDQFDPEVLEDGRVMFVSYDDAGANIYEVAGGRVLRHTDQGGGLFDVSPGPDGSIWALHHHGRKRVPVRIHKRALKGEAVEEAPEDGGAGPIPRTPLLVDQQYDPLSISNWQPGGLFVRAGFSGDSVFGSLVVSAHDRLRDHGLILSASVFGDFQRTDAELTYVNQEKRVLWGTGVFHDVSARVDTTFDRSDDIRFVSYQRFFGAQGIARYPFSRFFNVQGALAVGGADYFVTDQTGEALADPEQNDAERDLLTPWEADNEGMRFNTEATVGIGYSTIGYHRATGPIRGASLLLTHSVGTQPFDDVTYQQSRLDAEQYVRVSGAANLLFRGALGATVGNRRAPQFFLSSFHTLRGVPFADTEFLLGREFFYTTAEFQFPIVTFVRFPLIDLEGVLAADFGGVGNGVDDLWDRRVLDLVFGANLGFAPIVLRLHFAQPVGIGATLPNQGDLTFNFSLAWRYR
ncbi:MAG: tolB protein precursor protein [Myxococcales bacterium]|nr:tolB protein precursor protein [Myxococcales bacterium]